MTAKQLAAPLGIKIIAGLYCLQALWQLALVSLPAPIFGLLLDGSVAAYFRLGCAVIIVFVGLGLWSLRDIARRMAIGIQMYSLANLSWGMVYGFSNWDPKASKYHPVFSAIVLALIFIVPISAESTVLFFLMRKKAAFATQPS